MSCEILILTNVILNVKLKQESPTAWTQEAYRPPRSHSICRGGGVPWQNFFSPIWTCIKPNLVSKNFPFTGGKGGGGLPWQIFFFQSEHVSSQIWCQKFFPLLGGVPRQKNFFPVWTCIKPNLVSKFFPFTETRYPPPKIWDWDPPSPENLRLGPPPKNLRPGTPLQKSETGIPPKIWDWAPPPKILDGVPPRIWDRDLGPPPRNVDRLKI